MIQTILALYAKKYVACRPGNTETDNIRDKEKQKKNMKILSYFVEISMFFFCFGERFKIFPVYFHSFLVRRVYNKYKKENNQYIRRNFK